MAERTTSNMLVLIIICLAGLLILFLIVKNIRMVTEDAVEDAECKNGVLQHALAVKMTREDVEPEIKCRTNKITVYEADEEAVKKQIAERMRVCWSTWGEGKLTLFQKEGIYCHVCDIIEFKDRVEVNNFALWLNTHEIPLKNTTYAEYMSAVNREESLIEHPPQPQITDSFTTDERYSVIFTYAKGQSAITEFLAGNRGFFLAGGTGAVLAGTLFSAGVIAVSGPIGWILGGVAVAGAGVGSVAFSLTSPDIGWISTVSFVEYNADNIKALNCEIAPAVP